MSSPNVVCEELQTFKVTKNPPLTPILIKRHLFLPFKELANKPNLWKLRAMA